MGQPGEQYITGLHYSWRKCPEPSFPSTFRGPGDPQEEIVHGRPSGLGPGPGEPEYGTQSQFNPSEMALPSFCLQVETNTNGEAEEETTWR